MSSSAYLAKASGLMVSGVAPCLPQVCLISALAVILPISALSLFTISRGSVSVQETLVVQLAADGKYGYGEATTNSFYGATIPNMTSVIESVRSVVEGGSLDGPLQLIDQISRKLPKERYAKFALNAIDQAIHDLWGKLRGAPVYRMWGLTLDKIPMSDYTLGIDTPEKMVALGEENLREAIKTIGLFRGKAKNVIALSQPGNFTDLLTEVLCTGARALLAKAVEAEAADFLEQYAELKTEDGRQRVVRHVVGQLDCLPDLQR